MARSPLGSLTLERHDEQLVTVRRFDAEPELAEEIRREATAAAQLTTPAVLQPLQVEVRGTEVELITAAIEGRTLRDVLMTLADAGEQLAVSHATHIAIEVLTALEAAHADGVFHGRLSPEHIVLTETGQVHVTGFGLDAAARALLPPEARTERAFAYVSPEQALGGAPGPSSDNFALASILAEVITGQPLFLRATFAETYRAIEAVRVPSLKNARDNVPKALDEALGWALEKHAEHRPKSPAAFRQRLQAFQGVLAVGDHVKRGEQPRRLAELLQRRPSTAVDIEEELDAEDGGDDARARAAADEFDDQPTRVVTKSRLKLAKKTAQLKKKSGWPRRVAGALLALVFAALGVGVWATWPVLRVRLAGKLPAALSEPLGIPAAAPAAVAPRAAPTRAVPDAGETISDAGETISDAGETISDAGQASDAGAPAEAPPAPRPALLTVKSTPSAEVTLDGKLIGKSPLTDVEVEAGDHTLEFLSRKPRLRLRQKVTLAEGEAKLVQVKLKKR